VKSIRTAWGVLGITFGLCIGALYAHSAQQSSSLAVVIEIRYETSGIAQLFYNIGHGIIEADSVKVSAVASSDYSALRFPVTANTIRALRFDPLTSAGAFAIRRAYIEDSRHKIVHEFPRKDLLPASQIASRVDTGSMVRFATTPDANDASVTLALHGAVHPSTYWRNIELFILELLLSAAIAVVATLVYVRVHEIAAVERVLDRVAAAISDKEFIVFDRFAISYYFAVAFIFVVMVAGGFNGSSISLLTSEHTSNPSLGQPLVGTAKSIRSDEWVYHTPVILNQMYRAHHLEASSSELGPDYASLLGNIPVRHITTLFRPQFWGFFFLPPVYAFSFYWQFKGLLLLTGIFTLLLLLTGSSQIAAFGALWYWISAFAQWTYSWPSLLPEMVGLFCLVMCTTFYLSVGTRPWLRLAAGVICISSAVNFAMCAYVPHQISLVWLGVFLTAWWCAARWTSIFTHKTALARLGTLCAVWTVVGAIMLLFYLDAQHAMVVLANTIYPGRRSSPGGGLSIQVLLSNLFQYWQDDTRMPAVFGNICEGAGFLWLAPVTLFCLSGLDRRQATRKLAFFFLLLFSVFLFCWLTLPVPARIGRLVLLDMSGTNRSIQALGLANIGLVTLCLSFRRRRPETGRRIADTLLLTVSIFASAWPILFFTNRIDGDFLSLPELTLAVGYTTLVIVALIENRFRLLAASIIFPQIIFFSFVNPLNRGLQAVESTPLFRFVQGHPELLQQKWIVYSPSVVDAGVFMAVGCDVVNGMKYVPDFKLLGKFDPAGTYLGAINVSGFMLAEPGYGLPRAKFETIDVGSMKWTVNPLDPVLNQVGVHYAAFGQPPPAEIAAKMNLLSPGSVGGYYLYELRAGL
jgi:hypothetical protein